MGDNTAERRPWAPASPAAPAAFTALTSPADGHCSRRFVVVFAALTALGVIVNMRPYLTGVDARDAATVAWVAATYATHAAIYVALMLAPASILAVLGRTSLSVFAAVGFASAGQFALFADAFIHARFGYHVNGFVWNLVTTPGGLESMGGDPSTETTVATIALGIVLAQATAAFLAYRAARGRGGAGAAPLWGGPRRLALVVLAFFAVDMGGRVAYGVAHLKGFAPIVSAATAFPLYMPLTFRGFARARGLLPEERPGIKMRTGLGRLTYPKRPVTARAGAASPNIVWITCESLRADMLDPEIMPRTTAFAARAARFATHYSTGNGTRMGMFGQFYGLYGPYWFRFLEVTRGPVLIDHLKERGYRLRMHTSAVFTYPEFDRTIFAAVPSSDLVPQEGAGPGWEIDRVNVKKMFSFIDERKDAAGAYAEPFMTFQFFEGAHARYHFPPESVIRPDYKQDMNYAKLDLQGDMPGVKSRYVNAVHELDKQIGSVIDGLESRGLLERTIVIVTGDHGEEFMEKGRWGHNSEFSEEQIRTPLIIRMPGRAPEVVTRTTSHLDIAPTVLTALGVENPPSDYCQGYDLFGKERREFCVLAAWTELCYRDDEWKAVYPIGVGSGGLGARVSTSEDGRVEDESRFLKERQARLFGVLEGLREFGK